MLTILCDKEIKPHPVLKEYHWKISVGDLEADVFAECYIEFNTTTYDVAIAINNCLTAVQERLLDLEEARVITQQQSEDKDEKTKESPALPVSN